MSNHARITLQKGDPLAGRSFGEEPYPKPSPETLQNNITIDRDGEGFYVAHYADQEIAAAADWDELMEALLDQRISPRRDSLSLFYIGDPGYIDLMRPDRTRIHGWVDMYPKMRPATKEAKAMSSDKTRYVPIEAPRTASPHGYEDPYAFDDFTWAYVDAALWASSDDGDTSLDANYATQDIDADTLAQMKADCEKFQAENADDLAEGSDRDGGHDFWLTRNGHGAGFWDGGWPENVEDRLTDAAAVYGEYDLYVGDDGKIHGYQG